MPRNREIGNPSLPPDGMTEGSWDPRVGDLVFARSLSSAKTLNPIKSTGDALGRMIGDLHGFFTHIGIVVEVEVRVEAGTKKETKSLRICHAAKTGLIEDTYEVFVKEHASDGEGRKGAMAYGRLADPTRAEAAANAVRERSELRPTVFTRLRRRLGNDQADLAFSGIDLGLAGAVLSRAKTRSATSIVKPVFSPEDVQGLSDHEPHDFEQGPIDLYGYTAKKEVKEIIAYDRTYRTVNRARSRRKSTCAGRIYLALQDADYQIAPAFLADVYRVGQWVFDPTSGTFHYDGMPDVFGEPDATDTTLGDLNVFDLVGLAGGVDERGKTYFRSNDPIWDQFDVTENVGQYLRNQWKKATARDLAPDADPFRSWATLMSHWEFVAVGLGAMAGYGIGLPRRTAYPIHTVIGPMDIWDSCDVETRGFAHGEHHFCEWIAERMTQPGAEHVS